VRQVAQVIGIFNTRVRLAAENDRLHEACALLCEELRIKDTHTRIMAQIAPQRRPHYGTHERMAVLELRAARDYRDFYVFQFRRGMSEQVTYFF